ncbi:LPS assembly protein LptD [Sulfurimonas sp. HSL-1656]|uniref:LPS-assembly protein LptD n=1 Tax=Thiomicrolovo subterrani TaxID=3131934 RepID=UPI0031F850C2
MTAPPAPSLSMLRFFLLLTLVLTALRAENQIEFFATRLDSNLSVVHASGDVLVLYKSYYLSANEAYFDRNSSTLELFGNIVAMQGSDYFAMGDYAKLDVAKKSREFSPFFMLDRHTNVWMSSSRSGAEDKDFTVEKGMVSGCDPNDPFWVLYFSSADFDSESRWMNVYNAYLKIYGIPVFYFPYFGYSLDNRRRSGLLVPSFGVSSTEGFFVEQPVYIAIDPSWDVELRPQIRTERGEGLYGKFRFVDSNVSKGSINAGYFQEKSSYVDTYDLANSNHYGFDFFYTNTAVLQRWLGLDLHGQSGLYADIKWMNDIDYINLSSNDTVNYATSNQVLSRVNLFYNEENAYYGMNLRYYLDLNKKSNADTPQNLPILRYHRYIDTFLDEHVYYTFNLRGNNIFRETGMRAVEGEVDLPVTLQTSALEDYLLLSYSARLNGKYITFGNEPTSVSAIPTGGMYESGLFGRIYHVFDAGTQVTKAFDGFSHTAGLDLAYTKAGVDDATGYYETQQSLCTGSDAALYPECDFYAVNEIEEALDLKFSQFFVNDEGEQVLYHRISQRFSFDRYQDQLSELENELDWQVTPEISLYSDVFYNYDYHRVSKTLNGVRYSDDAFNVGVTDLYEDQPDVNGTNRVNYLTFDAVYRYNDHYRYFGRYAYDLEEHVKKLSEIGFDYTKRCWKFGMRYVENNRPILTNAQTDSVLEKYVYFTVELRPIGGTEVNYKLSDVLDGS